MYNHKNMYNYEEADPTIDIPSKQELCNAIINALEQLGGEAPVRQINDKIIEILAIPDEVVNLEDENGIDTKLNYRLRWCRTELKSQHILESVRRGVWKLV